MVHSLESKKESIRWWNYWSKTDILSHCGKCVRCTSAHQMSHSKSMIFRMFVVLSRSKKLRDSFSSSPIASLTCGKEEPAVKWPSSSLCATRLGWEVLTLSEKKMTSGASTRFSRAADLSRSSASRKRPRETNQRGDSGISLTKRCHSFHLSVAFKSRN